MSNQKKSLNFLRNCINLLIYKKHLKRLLSSYSTTILVSKKNTKLCHSDIFKIIKELDLPSGKNKRLKKRLPLKTASN